MEKIYVLSAVRTPIGKFGGAFKDVSAVTLGAAASVEAMKRAGVSPGQVDEVIFGMARQAGNRPNPARQILYQSGIPVEKTAYTINMACASGMKAIGLGFESLLLGENAIVLAGGTENMSQIPYLLDSARWGYRLGDGAVVDAMYRDGLFCPLADMVMGATAEVLAEKYKISRREQDEFAYESQAKTGAAMDGGRFAAEIIPVMTKGKRADVLIDRDEHPRPDTTLEKLAGLPPVFKKDGTVTAGNSSGLTDGAAALVLATESSAQKLGLKPVAEILAVTSAGVEPREMGLGPVPATQKVLKILNLNLSDFDIIEINEAFAAQVLAVERELRWDTARRNIHGGAIALGHPTGCTGARITATLLYALIQRDKELGLATLCVSGGQGMALVLKRL